MKVERLVTAVALALWGIVGCGGDDDPAPIAATPSYTQTAVPPSPTPTPVPPTPAGDGRCSEGLSCAALDGFEATQDDCCSLVRSLGGARDYSWCPPEAIDGTGACSQCLGDPCEGLPTSTPTRTRTVTPTVTATATPTATLSSLALQIRDVITFASQVCPPPMHLGPYLTLACADEMCGFDCDYFSGHGGGADLQHFASDEEAAAAYDGFRAGAEHGELHGLPAFFAVYPWNAGPEASIRRGAFRAGCWLATAASYDDDSMLIGAPPSETLERVYQRATALGLFEDCLP